MSLNNRNARKIVFDLETVSLQDVANYLDAPKPKGNLKDPVKIAADLEEKRIEQLETASLDPDLCRIVALGWVEEGFDEPVVCLARTAEEEAGMLHAFWLSLDGRNTVGYNSLGFDLPILMRRSLYLGVPCPMLNLDKYRSPHVDLQQHLSHRGLLKYRSLSWYCRRFGLDVPEDVTTGADIAALVAAGKWDAVKAHCQADVLKTRALAQRLGLFQGASVLAMSEAAF